MTGLGVLEKDTLTALPTTEWPSNARSPRTYHYGKILFHMMPAGVSLEYIKVTPVRSTFHNLVFDPLPKMSYIIDNSLTKHIASDEKSLDGTLYSQSTYVPPPPNYSSSSNSSPIVYSWARTGFNTSKFSRLPSSRNDIDTTSIQTIQVPDSDSFTDEKAQPNPSRSTSLSPSYNMSFGCKSIMLYTGESDLRQSKAPRQVLIDVQSEGYFNSRSQYVDSESPVHASVEMSRANKESGVEPDGLLSK